MDDDFPVSYILYIFKIVMAITDLHLPSGQYLRTPQNARDEMDKKSGKLYSKSRNLPVMVSVFHGRSRPFLSNRFLSTLNS